MVESLDYISKTKDSGADTLSFIKKWVKIKPEKAKELRKKIEALKLMKVDEKHISKIIDLAPEKPEDLNKIFTDRGLDEDETKKILETIKQNK